jgi:hypothetical protein
MASFPAGATPRTVGFGSAAAVMARGDAATSATFTAHRRRCYSLLPAGGLGDSAARTAVGVLANLPSVAGTGGDPLAGRLLREA